MNLITIQKLVTMKPIIEYTLIFALGGAIIFTILWLYVSLKEKIKDALKDITSIESSLNKSIKELDDSLIKKDSELTEYCNNINNKAGNNKSKIKQLEELINKR